MVSPTDKTRIRIATVAAILCLVLCSGIPIALGMGVWLDVIEFEEWQAAVVGGCIVGLWRFAVWLKPDQPAKAAADGSEADRAADDSTSNGVRRRVAAALRALFDGRL